MDGKCNIFPECSSCERSLSCFKKIAGVLSDEEIKSLKIVKNGVQESHNPTVYDLRLGDYHYLYSGEHDADGNTKWKAIYIGKDRLDVINNGWENQTDRFEHQNGADYTKLVIPPLGSALIELYETIDTNTVANDGILVTGRFDLKLSLVNKGLISQQGTQIEPCYEGKMYCFIHNLSGEEITLRRRQAIASIEFSYVSCFCNAEKRQQIIKELRKKNHKTRRYSDSETCNVDKGINNIRYFKQKRQLPDSCGLYSFISQIPSKVEEQVVSDSAIKKIKDAINFRVEIIKVIIPAIASIIVAIIAGYFAIVKPFAEYKTQISELQKRIELLESTTENWEDELSTDLPQITPGSDGN